MNVVIVECFKHFCPCFLPHVLTMSPTPEASIRFSRPSPPQHQQRNPTPQPQIPHHQRLPHHYRHHEPNTTHSKPNQHNLGVLTTRSKGDSTVGPSETRRFFFSSHFPYLFKVFTLLFDRTNNRVLHNAQKTHIFCREQAQVKGIFSSWAGKARR